MFSISPVFPLYLKHASGPHPEQSSYRALPDLSKRAHFPAASDICSHWHHCLELSPVWKQRKLGHSWIIAPLQGFPHWLCTQPPSGGLAGPHLSQLPTGLLEGTWGTEPDPGSGSPLKQLMELVQSGGLCASIFPFFK